MTPLSSGPGPSTPMAKKATSPTRRQPKRKAKAHWGGSPPKRTKASAASPESTPEPLVHKGSASENEADDDEVLVSSPDVVPLSQGKDDERHHNEELSPLPWQQEPVPHQQEQPQQQQEQPPPQQEEQAPQQEEQAPQRGVVDPSTMPAIPPSWTLAASADEALDDVLTALNDKSEHEINELGTERAANTHDKEEELLKDPEMKLLYEAAMTGVNVKCKLGRRFNRDAEGGQAQGYKECKSNADRTEFRKKWAETKYEHLLEKRKHVQSFEITEGVEGEYMSLNQLYVDEGGSNGDQKPEVVKAVKKYVAKCLVVGNTWLKWDGMSEQANDIDLIKNLDDFYTQVGPEARERGQVGDGDASI
jgi:hypothetical protein